MTVNVTALLQQQQLLLWQQQLSLLRQCYRCESKSSCNGNSYCCDGNSYPCYGSVIKAKVTAILQRQQLLQWQQQLSMLRQHYHCKINSNLATAVAEIILWRQQLLAGKASWHSETSKNCSECSGRNNHHTSSAETDTSTVPTMFRQQQSRILTVLRSSMRVMTPMAISLLSAWVSGHGYRVALNLLSNKVNHNHCFKAWKPRSTQHT